VDLLLVDRSGTIVADLGGLMDRNPKSGSASVGLSNSQSSAQQSAMASAVEEDERAPSSS
jgi:hypothetical protein